MAAYAMIGSAIARVNRRHASRTNGSRKSAPPTVRTAATETGDRPPSIAMRATMPLSAKNTQAMITSSAPAR